VLGRFGGELLRPSDAGYEPARRVLNGAIDRRPALVARCARVDDVIAAIAHQRVRAAFSPTTWERLRQVKRCYDPDNLLRHNHNIPPA
jgi:hypothetical protein